MELVGHGDERETLGVSANSTTDPDARARCETDSDLSARSQSSVIRLLRSTIAHCGPAITTMPIQTPRPPKQAFVVSPKSSLRLWWPEFREPTDRPVAR